MPHSWPVTLENSRADIDSNVVRARLDRVLSLVQRHVPTRYQRMQGDVAAFHILRYPCRGAFNPSTRECIVELTFIADPARSDGEIAATIVHEAEHAFVRGNRVDIALADEERRCREAELELGRLLSDERVIARATQSLMLEDDGVAPAIDWNEAWRRVEENDTHAS